MWIHLLTCIDYSLDTHSLPSKLFLTILLGAKDSTGGKYNSCFQMLPAGSGSIALCLGFVSTQEKYELWYLPSACIKSGGAESLSCKGSWRIGMSMPFLILYPQPLLPAQHRLRPIHDCWGALCQSSAQLGASLQCLVSARGHSDTRICPPPWQPILLWITLVTRK